MRIGIKRYYKFKTDAKKAMRQYLKNFGGYPYHGSAFIRWQLMENGEWWHCLQTSHYGAD